MRTIPKRMVKQTGSKQAFFFYKVPVKMENQIIKAGYTCKIAIKYFDLSY